MRMGLVLLAVVLGIAQRAAGVTLIQPFDLTLVGDDPSQAITLNNPFLTDQPLEVFFQGFAENLNGPPYDEHGVRVEFTDRLSDFVTLPSRKSIDCTGAGPAVVPLDVRGSSLHDDYLLRGRRARRRIHLAGTLTHIGTVPKPSAAALAVCGLLGALVVRRQCAGVDYRKKDGSLRDHSPYC